MIPSPAPSSVFERKYSATVVAVSMAPPPTPGQDALQGLGHTFVEPTTIIPHLSSGLRELSISTGARAGGAKADELAPANSHATGVRNRSLHEPCPRSRADTIGRDV